MVTFFSFIILLFLIMEGLCFDMLAMIADFFNSYFNG